VVVVATGPCAAVTIIVTADETEAASLLSPPYEATIEWVPATREVVLKVAIPPPFKDVVPRVVVPSRNVIVPVGTLLPAWGITVAVKVTLCPGVSWVAEAESEVAVSTLL
jgi:hypothetical protein